MCLQKNSGYVFNGTGCGCGCGGGLADAAPGPDESPKNKTEKDVKKEAEKYTNPEVPIYNKVFGGTLILVTLMILTSGGNNANKKK